MTCQLVFLPVFRVIGSAQTCNTISNSTKPRVTTYSPIPIDAELTPRVFYCNFLGRFGS